MGELGELVHVVWMELHSLDADELSSLIQFHLGMTYQHRLELAHVGHLEVQVLRLMNDL